MSKVCRDQTIDIKKSAFYNFAICKKLCITHLKQGA